MVRRFFLILVPVILLSNALHSQASYFRPNASAYNPNNDHYYITNYLGKSVVKTDRFGNKSYFIQNLDAPNNILFGKFPFGEAFIVLDSNKGKVFDTSGSLMASVSIPNAIKLMDLVYDDSLQAIYSTDVEKGVIYKTTFGAAPNFTPSTSVWVSGISRPSNLIIQKSKRRILLVQDTALSNLISIEIDSKSVSILRATGLSNLSGLAEDAQGNLYLSSQYEKNIYQWNKYLTGSPKRVVGEPKPGDIFVNAAKDEWVYCCIICGNVYIAKMHTFGPAIELYACAGDSVDVYKNTLIKCLGTFEPGNQFILELSAPSGNFDTATVLNVSDDTLQPFYMRVKIPQNQIGSNNYKYRFRTTQPAVIGFAEVAKIGAATDQQFILDSMAFCGRGHEILIPRDTQNVTLYWKKKNGIDSLQGYYQVSDKSEWVVLQTKNVAGCFSTDSVYTYPLFEGKPKLAVKSDSIIYCVSFPKNARGFQWIKNGVYLKDTSAEITVHDSGYYQVVFTAKAQNDCDYISDSLFAKYLPKPLMGVCQTVKNKTLVFPNPSNRYLNLFSEFEIRQIGLYNALGQRVGQFHNKGKNAQIDLSGYSEGIYWVEVIYQSTNSDRFRIEKIEN